MRDILVSSYLDGNNVALLSFSVNKESKRTPAELAYEMAHFKDRFAKVGAHFDRHSVTYRPRTPRNRDGVRQYPRNGIANPLTIDAGGSSCTFDDYGNYDCTGGESGGTDGYNVDTWDWWGSDGDTSDWRAIPSFPVGNDNGDRDPCLSSSGENICQQVVVSATRPNLSGCMFTPIGSACVVRPPPVPVDPYLEIPPAPSGKRPWFPQGMCTRIHILCSEGQIPEEIGNPPVGDYEALVEWVQTCLDHAQGKLNMCKALSPFNNMEWLSHCTKTASDMANSCMVEFKRLSQ